MGGWGASQAYDEGSIPFTRSSYSNRLLPLDEKRGSRQSVRNPQGLDGAAHFLTRTLDKVPTEMSLHVLAYNIKRVIAIIGVEPLMAAVRT
jgi:hypothetical protein